MGSRSIYGVKEGRQACRPVLKAGRKSLFGVQKRGSGHLPLLLMNSRQVTASVLLPYVQGKGVNAFKQYVFPKVTVFFSDKKAEFRELT